MGFWDTLVGNITGRGKKEPRAYANVYPLYEQQSPQYPSPSPYSLMEAGYRCNEVIYSCIGKRAKAISEAPLWVYDDTDETPEEIEDHPLRMLLRRPNERVTEKQFWQISQIHLDIAGFAAWEIERNNIGEPIALWPMRPDWCSFYRGDGRPLRAVRYQPYGLPPMDIEIDNVLLFQYFDPKYPLLKGYSPTMAALRQIGVDNSTTDFLKIFMQEGAQFAGLLSTTQKLNDIEAERIQNRWTKQHGGVGNWSKVAVLGEGVTYQSVQMNFRDMVFPELDARTESRICMTFETPPILMGAKIGMDRSTYSNYAESRKAWYEEWVNPQWEFLASQVQEQMLDEYTEQPENYICQFYTRNVRALQEDETAIWTRTVDAATRNIITRDEAREKMGYDAIDEVPVFVGMGAPAVGEEAEPGPTAEEMAQQFSSGSGNGNTRWNAEDQEGSDAEQELEEKQWRAFARKREGNLAGLKSFAWRYTPRWKQAIFLAEVGVPVDAPFQGYTDD